MFDQCNCLKSLPNISKWDTSNVVKMSGVFQGCTSLIYIDDISKWKTNKVIDMNCFFINANH